MTEQRNDRPRFRITLRRHRRPRPGLTQLGYFLVALGAAWASAQVTRGPMITAAAAREALLAIAVSMASLMVLLYSLLFVVVQWAHTTFSPRLSLFRDSPLVVQAFGLFIGTITYALTTGPLIADRRDVSAATAVVGVLAVAASLAVAATLERRALGMIQLPTVLDALDRLGVAVINDLYPDPVTDCAPSAATPASAVLQPVTQSVHAASSGTLQEIDLAKLVDLARNADGVVRLHVMVGDSVALHQTAITVSAQRHIDEAKLQRCLIMGVERTFTQDPKYVLRILADIGTRALSPAVNDPTTAVDVLNVVERLLALLGTRDLGTGVQRDPAGVARVVLPTADWENFVSIGLDEIRQFGTPSMQVTRRLVSMLGTLADEVPEHRRAALTDRLRRIHHAIPEAFSDPDDRVQAATADRQGLGGSHPR